jgi:hypothetical protein
MASVLNLSSRFEILGPAAVYAVRSFGETVIFFTLLSVLVIWSLAPIILSVIHFSYLRKEEK